MIKTVISSSIPSCLLRDHSFQIFLLFLGICLCMSRYMLPLWFLDFWIFSFYPLTFYMVKILLPFIMSPTTSNLPSIPQTPNIIILRGGERRVKKVWGLVLWYIVKCIWTDKEEKKVTTISYPGLALHPWDSRCLMYINSRNPHKVGIRIVPIPTMRRLRDGLSN